MTIARPSMLALSLLLASSYAAGLSRITTRYVWASGRAGPGDAGALARVDTSNGGVEIFDLPAGGSGAVDAAGNLWFASGDTRLIYKVNAADGRATSYDDGETPRAVAFDAAGGVFVLNIESTVSKLDASSGRVLWTAKLNAARAVLISMTVDAFGDVWLPDSSANSVIKIDGSKGVVVGTYAVGSYPEGVTAGAFGDVWVSNTGGNTVTDLDASNGATIGSYGVGRSPNGMAVDASGNVWVANTAGNSVTGLRADGSMIGEFPVGAAPIGVAVDESGHVWVVNSLGRSVTELDGASGAALRTVPTGVTGAGLNWTGDLTGFALQSFVKRRPLKRALPQRPAPQSVPLTGPRVAVHRRPRVQPAEIESDVDAAPASVRPRPNDFALIVGIDGYRTVPHAAFGERDAESFKSYAEGVLGVPEENVIVLLGEKASRTDLTKYLEEWLPKNVTKESRVYFYYSGHGAPDPDKGTAYLVPWDGDPEFLQSSAYPLPLLYKDLEALQAKDVVVFLDSCFSGAGGRSLIASNLRPLVSVRDAPSPGRKLSVLTAATGGETAGSSDQKGHGVFTYYLLKGLQGEARSPSGHVDLASLSRYVGENVLRAAHRENREQHPKLTTATPELRLY